MHISDVFAVFFIYPALVIILSVLFLGESAWWFDYVCCVASFIGVVLIVKPEFIFHNSDRSSDYFYFFLVVIAALLKAFEDAFTRSLGKDMHYQAINLFYTTLGMAIFPLVMIGAGTQIPILSTADYLRFLCIGLFAWLYQTFATLAFQSEKAGRVSMINYLQVDIFYLVDLFVFDKPMLVTDLLGILMVFSFNFFNGVYKTMGRITAMNIKMLEFKKNCALKKEIENQGKN